MVSAGKKVLPCKLMTAWALTNTHFIASLAKTNFEQKIMKLLSYDPGI